MAEESPKISLPDILVGPRTAADFSEGDKVAPISFVIETLFPAATMLAELGERRGERNDMAVILAAFFDVASDALFMAGPLAAGTKMILVNPMLRSLAGFLVKPNPANQIPNGR